MLRAALPPRAHDALSWRLSIEPEGRCGAVNMAVDESLLDAAEHVGAATLRLYRWSPPCLSFGRNEPALTRYDRAVIDRLGLDVVRRPTGGRAVWHEDEVTYAVAAPIADFGSLRQSYLQIHERLARALRTLGAPAELAVTRPGLRVSDGPPSCFAQPVGGEILVHGKKVVGSAQVRLGRAFLQHGSILLGGSQDMIAAISYQPSVVGSATTLSAVLGRTIGFDEVVEAIVKSWGVVAPTHLDPPRTTSTGFERPSWTWRR